MSGLWESAPRGPGSLNGTTAENRMAQFIDWLKSRLGLEAPEPEDTLWRNDVRVRPKPRSAVKPKPAGTTVTDPVDFAPDVGGKIADGGPGKNVLIRNKYVREDTGTHETLKIVDDSLLDADDDFGEDPYNTGRFDRSKSWDSFRTRK